MKFNPMARFAFVSGFILFSFLVTRAIHADGATLLMTDLPSSVVAESSLKDSRADFLSMLKQIEPGKTTRAEIEKLLGERDGGPQGISNTRYFAPPNIMVEVPFDQTGGTWQDSNQVSGPILVTFAQRHNF